MLNTFAQIKANFKFKPQQFFIDNWTFRLHYRITFLLFLVATVLVTSRQYIGEHIRCISDSGVPDHVMNTFCFFTTTFTVLKHYEAALIESGDVAHPGVGSYGINSSEPIQRHAYYQWVPFVLFGQAIMFFLPHLFWKKLEGGRIRHLVRGLQLAAFALEDKDIQVGENSIPSKLKKEDGIKLIRKTFVERIYINSSWSKGLILCECINVLNVILQIYIIDVFLDRQFLSLGVQVMRDGLAQNVDILDKVFPKVTKCTFHKYGPSGSIQVHDAMCVMALNIINEKIYIILWFWMLFLTIVSIMAVMWRVVTICLHARSKKFNQLVFANSCPGRLNPWKLLTVTKNCNFTDWLFLKYVSKNVDGLVFRELFLGLADDLEEKMSIEESDEESVTSIEKNQKFD